MRRSAALIPRHATAEILPIALAIEHASKRGLARAMVGRLPRPREQVGA